MDSKVVWKLAKQSRSESFDQWHTVGFEHSTCMCRASHTLSRCKGSCATWESKEFLGFGSLTQRLFSITSRSVVS